MLECNLQLLDTPGTQLNNKDCQSHPRILARFPYDPDSKSRGTLASLKTRSFFTELGLNVEGFTKTMASTLAVLHWGAKVDGDDVEFVLESAQTLVYNQVPKLEEITQDTKRYSS